MKPQVNIFWFRRDLRLEDNCGLYHALKAGKPVVPVFIFDQQILDELEDRDDRRVAFIWTALLELQHELEKAGSTLDSRYGDPVELFNDLSNDYTIDQVFTNHDYEPYASERDGKIKDLLAQKGIGLQSFKDQVIFDKGEILKNDGQPFTIFTPYSRRWLEKINAFYLNSYPTTDYLGRFYQQSPKPFPSLSSMRFTFATSSPKGFPSRSLNADLIRHYETEREFPSIPGTSRLGVHLRFGTVSIRRVASKASSLNQTFLKELIWRDFFQMILWHFPKVVSHSFKGEYDKINWRNNDLEFERWRSGMTGYPLVDAGMRELNSTGFMHNRVRMVTASFLTKHLLIDWRWGEAYFARKLLDYELASNNGGWQWAAGTGCDAAPYFRIFNPTIQTRKFDPELKYIRKWIPELDELNYPSPMVEHEFARKRCIETYQKGLKK